MKKKCMAGVVAAFVACAGFSSDALAQWVVLDPANLAQNLLTAANTLEQINNQVKQLQNEAQSLANQSKNLAGLDFSALPAMKSALAATDQLIQQAQGLAFNVQQMETQFGTLYPQGIGATTSSAQMVQDAHARWRTSLQALQTAVRVQSQAVQNFQVDEDALSDLVARSQSAVGALQATQATNQLLALQVRQGVQAQQLTLTQGRAAALELARQAAVDARAREVRQRFSGSGTPYTPTAVDLFPGR